MCPLQFHQFHRFQVKLDSSWVWWPNCCSNYDGFKRWRNLDAPKAKRTFVASGKRHGWRSDPRVVEDPILNPYRDRTLMLATWEGCSADVSCICKSVKEILDDQCQASTLDFSWESKSLNKGPGDGYLTLIRYRVDQVFHNFLGSKSASMSWNQAWDLWDGWDTPWTFQHWKRVDYFLGVWEGHCSWGVLVQMIFATLS